MNSNNALSRIHEAVNKALMGAIVLPANSSFDAQAAGTAFYLGLTKMGKNVSLVASQKAKNDLVASDKIQQNLVTSGDSLVISFPYTDGAIDKVDYNIQNDHFNLTIAPRPGYPKLDPSQIKYTYAGGVLDFIIVIDAPTLQSLGSIYQDNETQFQGKEIINIDRHLTNSFYGTINFVNKTVSSNAELVFQVLQSLNIDIDRDIATNLYMGIAAATNNFSSYSVNADTFETIAKLLRVGAIRKTIRQPFAPANFQNRAISPPQNASFKMGQKPQSERQAIKPVSEVEREEQPEKQPTSQDWLKPKIFRGSGLI